jgi:prolyl-tRNA editing enzyme YbaK/EbsC (Cys-tRNA(Pro) deacylase)
MIGTMTPTLLQTIREWLSAGQVAFREVHHEPTLTSEDSARARGEDLRIGGKALLLKGDDEFALFVLPADCKVDSGAIRRELGIRKLRFATREELFAMTGLVPGSVPPFGRPVLSFPLYVDAGIAANERIAFNAGSLTDSIILAVPDYLRLAGPHRIFGFSDAGGKVDISRA